MARHAAGQTTHLKPRWKCQGNLEQELRARGFQYIAGADEVGRGSLFGAVVAGAVILSPDAPKFAGSMTASRLIRSAASVVRSRRTHSRARRCLGW